LEEEEVEVEVQEDFFRDELYVELIHLISKELYIKPAKILPNSRMENDFGIYGDEMFDFLIIYLKKFNVDLSEFIFEDYFNNEGDKLTANILIWLGIKKKPKDLTVYDLYKGIKQGILK